VASPENRRERIELRSALQIVPTKPVLAVRGLSVQSRDRTLLHDVNLEVGSNEIYGIIGPSGAGKSTLLRCLNRLIDLDEGLTATGIVEYLGKPVYGPGVDVDELRSWIGMLFQQPVVFPGSIEENVVFGVRRLRRLPKRQLRARAETALRRAALWDEVKDRLRESAATLSVGQRQRLCLARALAVEPRVLLMDEPTSALDPKATEAIEELIVRLKREHTIILVTHDMAQARRVADSVGCLCLRDGVGELAESAACTDFFDSPKTPEVIEFLGQGSTD